MIMAFLPIVEYFAYFAFLRNPEQRSGASGEARLHESAEHEIRLGERNEDDGPDNPFPNVVRHFLPLLGSHPTVDVVELFRVGRVVDFDFRGHASE